MPRDQRSDTDHSSTRCAARTDGPLAQTTSKNSHRARSMRVMIVDDEEEAADALGATRQFRLRTDLHRCYVIAMRGANDLRHAPRAEASIDLFLARPMNLSVLETLLRVESERLDRLT